MLTYKDCIQLHLIEMYLCESIFIDWNWFFWLCHIVIILNQNSWLSLYLCLSGPIQLPAATIVLVRDWQGPRPNCLHLFRCFDLWNELFGRIPQTALDWICVLPKTVAAILIHTLLWRHMTPTSNQNWKLQTNKQTNN